MSFLADELVDIITRMDEHKQRRLLEFAQHLMEETDQTSVKRSYTARELWAMPYEERNRLAMEALARADDDEVEFLETLDELDFDDE